MENFKSIVEGGGIPKPDKMKIIKVMRSTSFMNYRKDLEKQGIKVDFATSPFAYYKLTHRKWGKKSDGKERAIYITSKRNAGDDAEYISNDNIAMGELSENSQQSMFDKMKTKEELKELVREVVSEIVTENHNFKVGDEVKFNGNYDGVVVKVHTDGKLKGHIDVQKKGRTSTVTLHGGNKKEVRLAEAINEEMHDCIQDLMGDGLSYDEAERRCSRSWSERSGKRGKRGRRMRESEISENEGLKGEGANINPKILTPTEIQLAVGVINFFGTGSHPMADAKGLKYFKVEYLSDLIWNNRNKLTGEAKKHLSKLLGKLQKSIKEDSVTENKDINFVLDQLANAVDLYPRDEFAQHMASQTKYDEKDFEKLYDAYFKMKAMDRFHMATDINKSKKFLSKFGIKEEVQPVNEGMSDLEFVIDQLANSMEHYDEKEFVKHISKETKYNANSLKKVFNAYWDLGAMDRFKIGVDLNKTKKFLKKFGIK